MPISRSRPAATRSASARSTGPTSAATADGSRRQADRAQRRSASVIDGTSAARIPGPMSDRPRSWAVDHQMAQDYEHRSVTDTKRAKAERRGSDDDSRTPGDPTDL